MSSSIKCFKWLLISWLKERNVCTGLALTCSDCALNVTFQVTRKASWKHCQEWQIDLDLPSMTISLLLWLLFFHCSKSNEDFREATQLYENMVGVNRRHTTHWTKRETKGQTSQVIDMQLCRLSITCYRIGCRKRTLTFRSFISELRLPLWISLVSRGFQCLRWAEKLKLFLSSSVFMGPFSSYELLFIPRLDGVIHNSRFWNSKYSLFIFF